MALLAPGTNLDRLVDELVQLDEPTMQRFIESLPPDELAVVELALRRRVMDPWRRDPCAMATHLDDMLRPWRYVQIIGHHMRRLIDTAAGADIPDPLYRLIVMLPARYGKTLTSSIWSTVWGLDRYPWLKFILASYADDLAQTNSLMIRDILEQYAGVLRVKLRRDSRAAKHLRTTEGGQVRAVGVGSGLTGHGGDVLLMDDLFKNWEEAHSPAYRERAWNWYRSVLYTRQQRENSAIAYIGTRWHEDDLVGRLLDPPGDVEKEHWEVVRMPALAEEPNPHGKPWEQLPDPLGRAPGEPLEPERFSLDAVRMRAAALGSYLAAGMEQQRPSSMEGGVLKRAWWKWYGPRPLPHDADDWLISWDASFADKADSSYVVGQCWARRGANRFLIDQVRDRMDYPTFRRMLLTFGAKWSHVNRTLVENKANGPAVIADLRGIVPGLVDREPHGSKENRAHACAGLVEGGNVFLPDPGLNDIDSQVDRSFVHGFVDECATFPGGSNDDQVDAFTQAMLEWQNTEQAQMASYRRTTGVGRR